MAVTMENGLRLLIHELYRQFDKRLTLARHTGRRAAHHEPEKTEADDAEH